MTLLEALEQIEDPRLSRKREHHLIDIMAIAVLASICGADHWTEVEEFGKAKLNWLKTFLTLPNGIPSHDTFGRVFSLIDPKEFEKAFIDWVQSIAEIVKGQLIAIDGKTLRRSHDHSNGKSAIHMVSAWASANELVLGQVKTEEKSNEITAIPKLLEALAIEGCIISIDAMGCQKAIARQIKAQNADYLFSLKGNHEQLHEDVKLYLDAEIAKENSSLEYSEEVTGDHGRIETRKCWVTSDIDWLEQKDDWAGLKSICAVERERIIGDKTTTERSYYISSIFVGALLFSTLVRQHWGIENKVHWILDVAFREDENRVRKGYAPENMSILRHMTLNLLKQENSLKRGIATKRLKAGWDHDYLLKVIGI